MSLEKLMRIVNAETSEPIETICDIITKLLDNYGTNSFVDDDIEKSPSALGILIIEKLHSEKFLEIRFSYFCHKSGEDEETNNLSNKCHYCKKNLVDVMDSHDVNRVYNFNRTNYNLIAEFLLEYNRKRYFMNEVLKNFENLSKDKNQLIPFIGSGMSVPLGLPNWYNLLKSMESYLPTEAHKVIYNEYMEEGDFFSALDTLLKRSLYLTDEDHLKDEIVQVVAKPDLTITDDHHNFLDLAQINSEYYITTNYDLCMEMFLTQHKGYNTPISMDEIGNLRNMSTTGNCIIHLHGHINRKTTMIVTKKDYEDLYSDEKVLVQLSAIIGSRPLIFFGYSFKDKFFVDIYTRLTRVLKTTHYIVLINPDIQTIRELNKINVKVLGLKVEKKEDYAKAIKVLIDYINNN